VTGWVCRVTKVTDSQAREWKVTPPIAERPSPPPALPGGEQLTQSERMLATTKEKWELAEADRDKVPPAPPSVNRRQRQPGCLAKADSPPSPGGGDSQGPPIGGGGGWTPTLLKANFVSGFFLDQAPPTCTLPNKGVGGLHATAEIFDTGLGPSAPASSPPVGGGVSLTPLCGVSGEISDPN